MQTTQVIPTFRSCVPLEPMPLETISRDELRRKVDGGENFVLIDALAPMSFAHSHLPGAINLPPEWVD